MNNFVPISYIDNKGHKWEVDVLINPLTGERVRWDGKTGGLIIDTVPIQRIGTEKTLDADVDELLGETV